MNAGNLRMFASHEQGLMICQEFFETFLRDNDIQVLCRVGIAS